LRYYQKLFQPVFAAGNVVIVMTKVDSNDYVRLTRDQWGAKVEERRRAIGEILDYPIQNIFSLCSCFANRKLDKVIDRKPPGSLNFPPKNNLLGASLLARLQFITLVSQLSPISMEGHLFPLPPCMEAIRLNHLRIVEEKLNQLQLTLQTENEMAGMYIKRERELQSAIERLGVEMEANEKQQEEEKGPGSWRR